MSAKRNAKPATPVVPAAAFSPEQMQAMSAMIAAALQQAAPPAAGTVALATVAAPAVIENPRAMIGNFIAEGWEGGKGPMKGKFCVTLLKGRSRNGIAFTCQADVDELGSPLVSNLVAKCEKAAGRKLGK